MFDPLIMRGSAGRAVRQAKGPLAKRSAPEGAAGGARDLPPRRRRRRSRISGERVVRGTRNCSGGQRTGAPRSRAQGRPAQASRGKGRKPVASNFLVEGGIRHLRRSGQDSSPPAPAGGRLLQTGHPERRKARATHKGSHGGTNSRGAVEMITIKGAATRRARRGPGRREEGSGLTFGAEGPRGWAGGRQGPRAEGEPAVTGRISTGIARYQKNRGPGRNRATGR